MGNKKLENIFLIGNPNVGKTTIFNKLTNSFVNDFIKDTKVKLTFISNKYEFHSRYIIIDYKSNNWLLYHCGGSSKDGGNTTNTIIEIPEKEVYIPKIDNVLSNDEFSFK